MAYLLAQASAHRIPLKDESVQCCVCSPPYWGLRAYSGEQRFEWGGEEGHAHEYGSESRKSEHADRTSRGGVRDGTRGGQPSVTSRALDVSLGAHCPCGAWYGALGLEPTPDLYVEHIVEVFREVKRVLRKDGTLWLNLGDSYASSWGNQGRKPERGTQRPINGGMITPVLDGRYPVNESNTGVVPFGLKPKDLVGIPWRVAFALQADGWYLRSDIVWSKPNPMPESVTDRPTKSHEYLFLLAKSERYFYDADAIREPVTEASVEWNKYRHPRNALAPHAGHGSSKDEGRIQTDAAGRNARSVWNIATQPYPGAHFATFPEALPEKCILAGSKRGDVVLDTFNGSGTTGAVALRLGRSYVGLDLSREYLSEQALHRIDPLAGAAQDARNGMSKQAVMRF